MKLNPPNPLDSLVTLVILEFALGQREYQLSFSPQSKKVEIEFEQFPSMIKSFENHRCPNGLPPTQHEFVVGFEADYMATRPELFAPHVLDATVARLQKTYPSLVRDLHLYLLCKESKKFYRVIRDSELDERYGIDLLILGAQRHEYYICAMVGTGSGRSWRKFKQVTRNRMRPERVGLKGHFIELPLDGDKKTIGTGRHPWHLYSQVHAERIAARIAQLRKGQIAHAG